MNEYAESSCPEMYEAKNKENEIYEFSLNYKGTDYTVKSDLHTAMKLLNGKFNMQF